MPERLEAHKSVWFFQSGFRPLLQLIQLCIDNMMWFTKFFDPFSDSFSVVVPIVGVSNYGFFCSYCYGDL